MSNKILNIYGKSKLLKVIGPSRPPYSSPVPFICRQKHNLISEAYLYHRHLACTTLPLNIHDSPYLKINIRHFHTSYNNKSKEPSKVEETVKVLKEEKKVKEGVESEGTVLKSESAAAVSVAEKRSLGKRIWDEILHYYHGFRLLFVDIKISTRLAFKVARGEELTRREHRQLVRTVSDLFRLVPFSIFIIVPFMEFLLPVFLKFFPAMLPSTFTTKSERELKFRKGLRMKIEMAKFLQDTLNEMAVKTKGETHSHTAKEFAQFFERIRTTGEEASNEAILKFSKLFEDEITLDSLTRAQLIALCRLLELKPIGTNNFLRFQLRNRIRNLRADDRLIMKEGIDSMNIQELQAACRARGMRALGIPEERLKSQLKKWLELSLLENIPPSLLLLSRALYLPDKLPAADLLKVTLSSLSETAATETKLKIGEMEGKVDNKTKLELIKKQEEEIKKEAEELKQQKLEAEQKKEELSKKEKAADLDEYDKEILLDKAKIIEDRAELLEKSPPEAKENELSKEDFEEIESALENIAAEKNKLIIEKEEIEDLKEEMAEYKQDIKELQDVVLETGHKEIRESKAALRLSKRVDKMISNMDRLLDGLNKERDTLQQQIDSKVKEGVSIGKERDDIIGINELVLAIRRIQKVSDDTRLQRIADVLEKMDVDHDGAVEIDHVLKVIELLGEDNVKVTPEQMEGIIDLLMKEEALELEEKLMKENAADGKKTEEQSNK
ncbi:mitochondrial proton/calcium exchanger protein-like isoform X2 [Argiope bruennichi]|uniref:mitochondrial proton/calcium exchanger protein-like isoform X2 n=1 Tax=Argiope bruennichi TaxID=94029 RepID=UPI002494964D|nr:mitochondrial proton/calcium exchanger protein-like isoform X2 [Argiope bruennichi]